MKDKNKRIEKIIRLVYRRWKENLPKSKEPCPDEETLACFIDGLLNRKEGEKIRSHIIHCQRCMEVVVIASKMIN